MPPIGTKCIYNPGLEDGHHIFGKYFVEIIKYLQDMPVCKILQVLEEGANYAAAHEVGKEVFFITFTEEPNDVLKEII